MKTRAFRIALALFLILSLLTVFLSVLFSAITNDLISICSGLSDLPNAFSPVEYEKTAEQAHTLYRLWDRCVLPLSLTLNLSQIDRADHAINALLCAVDEKNREAYTAARAECEDALRRLNRQQGVGFYSVF